MPYMIFLFVEGYACKLLLDAYTVCVNCYCMPSCVVMDARSIHIQGRFTMVWSSLMIKVDNLYARLSGPAPR